MNNCKYKSHETRQQIEEVLHKIKQCVKSNCYVVALGENRQENRSFIQNYNIRMTKLKNILLSIQVDDFCYTLQNTNEGYEHEILYVFAPQVELFNALDERETVSIYAKFNLLEQPNGRKVVVISFHGLNYPISYPFR